MKERFDVTGMTCSACSSHVEKSVSKLTGVENVSVNLLTNSMQVEFDENKLDTAGRRARKIRGKNVWTVWQSGKQWTFSRRAECEKHEKETDRLTDFLDTVDVCVHGTYDISVAQHSDAAVYHELFAWK